MSNENQIYEIPLGQIVLSKLNVRQTDKEAQIDELAASIQRHGLLQPVVIRGTYGNPPYELVVGQRRFLAHQCLKKDHIRAVFMPINVSDTEAKIRSLAENLHRVQLNHADAAEAITALFKEYGGDINRVSKETSLSTQTVRDYIKIEEQATPKAKDLLRNRKVSKADVKRVIDASQGDPTKADRLLELIPKLIGYEKRRVVEYGQAHPTASAEAIIEEGAKSRIEKTVILNLTVEMDRALEIAERVLSLAREEIAIKALREWLAGKGFLR